MLTPTVKPPSSFHPGPGWEPLRVRYDAARVPYTNSWGLGLDVDLNRRSAPSGTLDVFAPNNRAMRHGWRPSWEATRARNALTDAIAGSSIPWTAVPWTGQRPLPGRQQLIVTYRNGQNLTFDLQSHMGDPGMRGVADALQGVLTYAFPDRYRMPYRTAA